MSAFTRYKKEAMDKVNELIQDIEERERDPLGYTICLYFLLESGLSSPQIDDLVDWMNSWVDKIVNNLKLGRFMDREIASALFGYYLLKKFKKLKIIVNERNIFKLVTNDTVKNGFYFGDPLYSSLILITIYDPNRKKSLNNSVLNALKESLFRQSFFNDPKRLIFISMLLEKTKDRNMLEKLFRLCEKRVLEEDIRFDDRVYYAWILWRYKHLTDKFLEIFNFVKNTLENAKVFLGLEQLERETIEYYGKPVYPRFSKIWVSVYINLISNFESFEPDIAPGTLSFIREKMIETECEKAWVEIENSLKAFKEGKLPECCDNLRSSLLLTWIRIYELIEGKILETKEGKTTDISPLVKCLAKREIPEDLVGMLRRTWSYVSERAHREKRRRESLSEFEVRYAIRMTIATIECLFKIYESLKYTSES